MEENKQSTSSVAPKVQYSYDTLAEVFSHADEISLYDLRPDELAEVPLEAREGTYTDCGLCGASWHVGLHCTSCHRTFGGKDSEGCFDAHQSDSEPVKCLDPSQRGLELKPSGKYERPIPTPFR